MKKSDLTNLAGDIAEAHRRALLAIADIDDSGTCNLDTLTLKLPRVRLKTLEDMGIDCYDLGGRIGIGGGMGFGQANRRTCGVRVMMDYLNSLGYNAGIHYQID